MIRDCRLGVQRGELQYAALEQDPFPRQAVEVRRRHAGIAVDSQSASSVIVGDDQEQVGTDLVADCRPRLEACGERQPDGYEQDGRDPESAEKRSRTVYPARWIESGCVHEISYEGLGAGVEGSNALTDSIKRARDRAKRLSGPAFCRRSDYARRPHGDDAAAGLAAVGAQVDHPVGGSDHVEVMLDDHDSVT